MSSSSAAERAANRVSDSVYDVRRKRDGFTRNVYSVDSWWQGEASVVFQKEYLEINAEIDKIFGSVFNMDSALRGLAKEVSYADEERRRKAEQLKMPIK